MEANFAELEENLSQIIPTNRGRLYDWHLYWSKKPHNVIDLVLAFFLQNGGTVLDPFMGSGTTLIAALNQNRGIHPIGVEINELPVEILRTILRESDLDRLQLLLSQVKNGLMDEHDKHYSIECSKCGNSGFLLKMEYDHVNGVDIPRKLQYHCSSCSRSYSSRILKEEIERQIAINDRLAVSPNESMKLLPNSRIAVKEGMYITDVFPKRAFYFLERIKRIIDSLEELPEKKDLKAVLSSCIHLAKFTDRKSQSQFPYWIPRKNRIERNVWCLFQDRFNKLMRMKEHQKEKSILANCSPLILNKPFQEINDSEIPLRSVDFVMTDPPYMDVIAYSEYLKLWEYFTGYKSIFENEIVVSNGERGKDFPKYFEDINKSFQLIYDVLKSNKFVCVWFNDTKLKNWCDFLDACCNAGFDFIKQISVGRSKHTYKQINTPKTTIKGDCLLIFKKKKKPLPRKRVEGKMTVNEAMIDFNAGVKDVLHNNKEGANTADIVNAGLIEDLYNKGRLHKLSERHKDLVECLEKVSTYDKDKNIWLWKPKNSLKFRDKNLELYLDDSLSLLDEFKENEFDACITDPPYNISGYDHKKKIGWLKSNPYWSEQKRFTKMSEEWDKFSNKDYTEFTRNWVQKIVKIVKKNGNIIIFGSMHNIFIIGEVLSELNRRTINSIVWFKRNAFPNITRRMLCESTEYIVWAVNNGRKEAKNWTFNYEIMKELNGGKQMRNMWDIPSTSQKEKKHGKHPAQKPLEVVKRLILGCTNEGDRIIDPFMGVGTVPLVSDIYGRKCTGVEKIEKYLRIAIRRVNDREYYERLL